MNNNKNYLISATFFRIEEKKPKQYSIQTENLPKDKKLNIIVKLRWWPGKYLL